MTSPHNNPQGTALEYLEKYLENKEGLHLKIIDMETWIRLTDITDALSEFDTRPHTSAPAPGTLHKISIIDAADAVGKASDRSFDSGYELGVQQGRAEAAKAAREQEAIRWFTALNTLIATESKRKDKKSVDMVYSYRVAQIIESLRSQQEAEQQ